MTFPQKPSSWHNKLDNYGPDQRTRTDAGANVVLVPVKPRSACHLSAILAYEDLGSEDE